MSTLRLAIAAFACTLAVPVQADDAAWLAMLRSDDPAQITEASKAVAAAGGASEQVLDTMAELLLLRATDRTDATYRQDVYLRALNWVCRSLGETRRGRYYSVLRNVSRNRHVERPVRKYCANGVDAIRQPEGPQYQQGMVSLDGDDAAPAAVSRPAGAKSAAAPRATPRPVAAQPESYSPLSALKVGMSLEDAVALVGPPTSMGGHATGKNYIPFNFKGGDTYRTIAYYKGQGRIVYSNVSRYNQAKVIAEIQLDAGEGGYH